MDIFEVDRPKNIVATKTVDLSKITKKRKPHIPSEDRRVGLTLGRRGEQDRRSRYPRGFHMKKVDRYPGWDTDERRSSYESNRRIATESRRQNA